MMGREALTETLYTRGRAPRGNVRQMSNVLAQQRAPKCLFPTFVFLPPGFPHISLRCCPPHFVHFVCSVSFVPACPTSLSLISDCPCQLFCWCFLLYFHLTPSCRAYQTLLTASAVRYPHCLLVGDILPLKCRT